MTNTETVESLYSSGEYEKCLILAENKLANNPSDFNALCYKGACLAKNAQYADAIAVLSKCVSVRDDLFFLWVLRGDCHYELKEFSKSFSDYWISVQLDPKNGAAVDKCARSLFLLGDENYALDFIQRAIKIGDSPEPVLVMVHMLRIIGRLNSAFAITRMGADKFPKDERFEKIGAELTKEGASL